MAFSGEKNGKHFRSTIKKKPYSIACLRRTIWPPIGRTPQGPDFRQQPQDSSRKGLPGEKLYSTTTFPWKKDHCLGIWIMNSSIR